VGFGLQHSGISSNRVKTRLINKCGKKSYSGIFTMTSLIMLWIAIQSLHYTEWLNFLNRDPSLNLSLFLPGLLLIIIGVIIGIFASKIISLSTVADMRSDRQEKLETGGIYGKIRHPLYLSSIMVFIGLAFVYPVSRIILFSITFCIYILIGGYLEEKKLIQHYGQEYLEYRKKVGFLIPKW
jgi:protein-S-isoprenylcysteine O-methyltransferase Ste14